MKQTLLKQTHGLIGISGESSDMREILASVKDNINGLYMHLMYSVTG